jgi:hypothetical protein
MPKLSTRRFQRASTGSRTLITRPLVLAKRYQDPRGGARNLLLAQVGRSYGLDAGLVKAAVQPRQVYQSAYLVPSRAAASEPLLTS